LAQIDVLPSALTKVREAARRAIAPIKPVDSKSVAERDFLFTAKRAEASTSLPPQYLVYFLLVDLLGFQNLGKFEKIAWSVPIDLEGVAYLIEYRKSGIGVFTRDGDSERREARRIVTLIQKGVKVAAPFFAWIAGNAASGSNLNVRNLGRPLFDRYVYFRDQSRLTSINGEAYERESRERLKQRDLPFRSELAKVTNPALRLSPNYLALAAIDAFFSWTEHIFIHIAILQGRATTGDEVAKIAVSNWDLKFKYALELRDPKVKKYYDELTEIRRQLRNFVAHGAFGKEGQAFDFHSSIGAVPVILEHNKSRFSLTLGLAFDNLAALDAIEEFISVLWSGPRMPAKIYIQETDLPLILTMVNDGRYQRQWLM
jgi:hypothetical protein